MCGRFVLDIDWPEVYARLDIEFLAGAMIPVRRSWNVAPTADAGIVRTEGGKRRVASARWGLVPASATDESVGVKMFNARSETAREKPAFRDAYRHRRCVVPMSGFYEWQRTPDGKRPWYVTRADGEAMWCAGLWESRERPGASPLETFTVLTTGPNGFMSKLHDRMPCVLEPESVGAWLDAGDRNGGALLAPAAEGVLAGHVVSNRVGSVRNDDASLVDPVETQGEMF